MPQAQRATKLEQLAMRADPSGTCRLMPQAGGAASILQCETCGQDHDGICPDHSSWLLFDEAEVGLGSLAVEILPDPGCQVPGFGRGRRLELRGDPRVGPALLAEGDTTVAAVRVGPREVSIVSIDCEGRATVAQTVCGSTVICDAPLSVAALETGEGRLVGENDCGCALNEIAGVLRSAQRRIDARLDALPWVTKSSRRPSRTIEPGMALRAGLTPRVPEPSWPSMATPSCRQPTAGQRHAITASIRSFFARRFADLTTVPSSTATETERRFATAFDEDAHLEFGCVDAARGSFLVRATDVPPVEQNSSCDALADYALFRARTSGTADLSYLGLGGTRVVDDENPISETVADLTGDGIPDVLLHSGPTAPWSPDGPRPSLACPWALFSVDFRDRVCVDVSGAPPGPGVIVTAEGAAVVVGHDVLGWNGRRLVPRDGHFEAIRAVLAQHAAASERLRQATDLLLRAPPAWPDGRRGCDASVVRSWIDDLAARLTWAGLPAERARALARSPTGCLE